MTEFQLKPYLSLNTDPTVISMQTVYRLELTNSHYDSVLHVFEITVKFNTKNVFICFIFVYIPSIHPVLLEKIEIYGFF